MQKFIQSRIIPGVIRFVDTRAIKSLKNGMIFTIPFIIIGSVFLILGNLPVTSWAKALDDAGLTVFFQQAYHSTFDMTAMIAVTGITYSWVKGEGYEPFPAAITAFTSFMLLQAQSITDPVSKNVVDGVISMDAFGGDAMVAAIIVGLLTGWIYTFFLRKKITIKLPESVPTNVADSFTALIPSFVITLGSLFIFAAFKIFGNTTFIDWIYTVLQIPLQGVTDSYVGIIVIAFIGPMLWLFGVHGAAIVYGVMLPLLQANSADNARILSETGKLTIENGGHIVTLAMMDNIINLTGSGFTIGIVFYMVFMAKSQQLKALGKIEGAPAIFNINEPILFGIPIVMNPILAVPFIGVPMIVGTLTYLLQFAGILPLFNGVVAPWTMPFGVSGLLVGGWQIALWQIVLVGLSIAIYMPFMRRQDASMLAQEQAIEESKGEA